VSPATVDYQGNINLIDAARAAGAQLVLMSVAGAAADSPMELFRMKHAAEEHLRASGVRWTIVRATAFFELWIDVLSQTAARSGRPLVFGRGDNPINFVSVTDVAALAEHAVTDPATRGRILQIGGPENLTFNQLAAAIQAAAGRTSAPRHVPPLVLQLMAQTAGRLKPALSRQARAALLMDRIRLDHDAGAARQTYPDIPFTPLGRCLGPRAGNIRSQAQ
jgi:NADH dehydrogenase